MKLPPRPRLGAALSVTFALCLLLVGGCGDEPTSDAPTIEESAANTTEPEEEAAGARSPITGRLDVIGNSGVGGTVTLRLTTVLKGSTRDPADAAKSQVSFWNPLGWTSGGVVTDRPLTNERVEWPVRLAKDTPQTFDLPVRLTAVGEYKVGAGVYIEWPDGRGVVGVGGGDEIYLNVTNTDTTVIRKADIARRNTPDDPALRSFVRAQLEAVDVGPLGGTARLTLTLRANLDTPDALPNGSRLSAEARFELPRGVVPVSGQPRQPLRLKKGETHTFVLNVRLTTPGEHKVTAGVWVTGSGQPAEGRPAGKDTLYFVVGSQSTEVHRVPGRPSPTVTGTSTAAPTLAPTRTAAPAATATATVPAMSTSTAAATPTPTPTATSGPPPNPSPRAGTP